MHFDTADDGFRETATQWLSSLNDATLGDLSAVLSLSPGFYPTTLYALWQDEIERRGVAALPRATCEAPRRPDVPVGHPHDCDWRFTPEAAGELVQRAVEDLAPGELVAHLGTPTTFTVGVERYPDFRHVLLERNSIMTAALRTKHPAGGEILCIDLAVSKPPPLGASAAILDPPWYLGDSLTFLAASSHLCHHGAHIWLCQPTQATRPGVEGERATLTAELPYLGLQLEATHTSAVRYTMPHFEAMSLRSTAASLRVPPDWRTGDLIVLRKIAAASREPAAPGSDTDWEEVHFGPVRIKLRVTDAIEELASLVPGDVLGTVSRRDPIRPRIGLWTSGNRVFALGDPERVGGLINLCNADLEAIRFTLARTLDHARQLGMSASTAQRLFDLLLVELQEHTASEGHTWASSRYLAS